MIQFNLLPDIKLEYIKAKRMKRTVILVTSIITGVSVAIFILLFVTVNVFQKNNMEDLSKEIQDQKAQLNSIEDLDKILTIQNQLGSLTSLHEKKPVAQRLFIYLPQLVPQLATISELELNFTDGLMEISGSADSLETVNKFVDTLKFTDFYNSETEQKVRAFSEVVMSDFRKTTEEANYTINMKFDPYIFDSANEVQLTVPQIISTRSETEKPSEIFKDQAIPIDVGDEL